MVGFVISVHHLSCLHPAHVSRLQPTCLPAEELCCQCYPSQPMAALLCRPCQLHWSYQSLPSSLAPITSILLSSAAAQHPPQRQCSHFLAVYCQAQLLNSPASAFTSDSTFASDYGAINTTSFTLALVAFSPPPMVAQNYASTAYPPPATMSAPPPPVREPVLAFAEPVLAFADAQARHACAVHSLLPGCLRCCRCLEGCCMPPPALMMQPAQAACPCTACQQFLPQCLQHR